MLNSKIDTEVTWKHRRRKIQCADCGRTAHRFYPAVLCRDCATTERRRQKREYQTKRRAQQRRTQKGKSAHESRMNAAALRRLKLLPPVAKASDIMHLDADKAARIITDVLNGKCVWARGADATISRPDQDSD